MAASPNRRLFTTYKPPRLEAGGHFWWFSAAGVTSGREVCTPGYVIPAAGERIAGKYVIERELGRGGMGIVFEASHLVTGKRFAVKWMLPELAESSSAVERFVREARVAGRVTHPNLVEVYDIGEAFGSSYMVMELLEGESLQDRLARVGRLSVDEACAIIMPCMRGLAKAHKAGVIHRDLKPANIFLCRANVERDELPKLVDFGIAKLFAAAGEVAPGATQEGAMIGTPDYMAPEQVRGAAIDARTDIYALGIVLYQVFAGRTPFRAKTVADMVVQVLAETPTPLRELAPDVPEPLAAAIARAMARDPNARFQTIEDFARALEPFARGLRFDSRIVAPAPEPPHSAGDRWPSEGSPARPQQPRSLRVPLSIGGALVLVLVGWFSLRGEPDSDAESSGAAGQGDAHAAKDGAGRRRVRELLRAAQLRAAPESCFLIEDPGELGNALERVQAAAAAKSLARAVQNERDPELLVWMAQKLRDEQALAEAGKAAAAALEHCADYAQAHATLGSIEYQAQHYEPAAREFEAALRLDPDLHAARFNLALSSIQRGDSRAAVVVLDELERRAPDYPRLYSARAQAHWIAGAVEPAARDAKLAIQREPDNARARALLQLINSGGPQAKP